MIRIRGTVGYTDGSERAFETGNAALTKVTPGAVELDVVAWLYRHGQQVKKWTTKSVSTAPVTHAPYAHFRDLAEPEGLAAQFASARTEARPAREADLPAKRL